MTAHTPLLVRAHLAAGIAQAAPWGIALDGLLAAELWADHKADRRDANDPTPGLLETAEPADLPLPLARCTSPDGLWHWAATCAHPEGRPDLPPDVQTWTGRTDSRALEQLTDQLPAVLSDRQGRYRARRMPLLVTACTAVAWRAVGDASAVRALLTGVTAIGKKRSTGHGHVLRWEVTATPHVDPWTASHLHPDGTLGRPTPDSCLHGQTIQHGGRGTAGLRPPYMHPARQHTLRLPALLDS